MSVPRAQDLPPRLSEQAYMATKSCRHGIFLYNVNDTFVGRSLDLYGEWCEDELLLLDQVLRPGQVVLDVGANVGTHTVFFAKRVGSDGVVFAFEPQRLVYQNLCANAALNALRNVVCHQAVVSDQTGVLRLPVYDPSQALNFGAIPAQEHPEGEVVDSITIDQLGLTRCDLMKIDVEGMETRVLQGARETITRFKPVLFLENDRVDHSAELIAALEAIGYVSYWQMANYYRPGNFFQNPDNVFARFHPACNMICFHRSQQVEMNGFEQVLGPDDNWLRAIERMRLR